MPAAIPIVAAVVGGYIASRGATKAADTQAASADRSADMAMQQYEQTRQDQAPWRQAGMSALSDLSAGIAPGGQYDKRFSMADYQADPGYQFRMSEGNKGIERAATAGGSRYSGATLKALSRFNSDLASQEYGKAYDRFNNDQTTRFNRGASIAGLGQTATAQTAASGQQAVNSAGQAIQNAGTSRASGYVGSANAINGTLGTLANNYTLSSMMPNKPGNPGSSAPAGTYYDGYSYVPNGS